MADIVLDFSKSKMIHNYTRVQVILLVFTPVCSMLHNMELLDHHSQLEVQMRYTVYNYNIIIYIYNIIAEKKTKNVSSAF